MKFKQIGTGTVLETENEDSIAMMNASDAYVAMGGPKGKGEKPSPKAEKATE